MSGAHGVPMYQNSTFGFRSYDQVMAFERGEIPHFVYQRYGTPTVRCLELKMASLEDTELSVATATGMAAITATLQQLLQGSGGHVVAADDLYQVTHEVLMKDVPCWGGSVTKVPIGDLEAVKRAIRPETRAIFAESLSNPHLEAADVPALATISRAHGARLVIDNTFLSPALYRPIGDGADLVVHSATKYLAGSGQVMGGFVSGRQELVGPIRDRIARQGAGLAPFGAWQILAGIKTLSLRMDRHSRMASTLAEICANHWAVQDVYYPGVPGNSSSAVAKRVLGERFGGLYSIRLFGGAEATRRFVDSLRIATIAVSLGEPTTLVWPFGDGLVRIAVGLEDPADLERDLRDALSAASIS